MSGRIPPGASSLARQAKVLWGQAALEEDPAERYRLAHVAALRGAAAILGARPSLPSRRASRPTSAWHLLDQAAPELADWSAFFRHSAVRRGAIEAGAQAHVTNRDADELVSAVSEFLALVGRLIGTVPTEFTGQLSWQHLTSLAS